MDFLGIMTTIISFYGCFYILAKSNATMRSIDVLRYTTSALYFITGLFGFFTFAGSDMVYFLYPIRIIALLAVMLAFYILEKTNGTI